MRDGQVSSEDRTFSKLIHLTLPKMICFAVLAPSNMNVKLKMASKSSAQNFTQPVLEAEIDLKQIHLHINRDQVEKKNPCLLDASLFCSFRIFLTFSNFEIILKYNQNIANTVKRLKRINPVCADGNSPTLSLSTKKFDLV